MKKQPDFRQQFYDYFGSKPKKVTYSIRSDSNRYHDIVFLNSLIHDARFKRNIITVRGKKLTIPINRDCWELGFIKHEKSSELHIADGNLCISPVIDFEWRIGNDVCFNDDFELWIHDLTIERLSYETLIIIIEGDGWSFRIKASDDDFKMRLQDTETPHIY